MRSHATLLLTIPIIVTSVLLLSIGGAAAWYVHQLNSEVSHLLADSLECTLACERLVLGIRDARRELDRFLHTGNRTHLQMAIATRNEIVRSLDDAERSAATQEVRNLLDRTRQSHDQFFAEVSVISTEPPSADKLELTVRTMSDQLTSEVLGPAEELLAYNQQSVTEHSNRSQIIADRVGLGLLTLGFCGAVAGLLAGFGVARNLTQRLEESKREATRAEQLAAVGQLAAGLAHELRNPLTSIKILIQAAAEQKDGAGLNGRDLAVVEEEINRLEQLVKTFLDFARPPTIERSTFDLRDLIGQTTRLVSGQASRQNVTFDYDAGKQPMSVNVDPVQVRQLLLNLLLNALDVLPDGGVVKVETQIENKPPGGSVVIRVSDSGPGVPGNAMDRIFQPFVSTKETGTGLGLAICRRIVEAHDGTIGVANRPEGGAEFTIRLPRSCSGENGPTAAEPHQPAETAGAELSGNTN